MVIEMRKHLKANFDTIRQNFSELADPEHIKTSDNTQEEDDQNTINIGKTGLHAFDASNKIYDLITNTKNHAEIEIEKNRKIDDSDLLTGCENRNSFEKFKKNFKPNHSPNTLGLIYIDLDNLKTTNDIHGHKAGDDLLISTATLLKSSFRREDRIFRLGGDEFLIVCEPNRQNNNLEKELTKKIEGLKTSKKLIASSGITIYSEEIDAGSIGNAVERADRIMLENKKQRKIIPNQ